MNTPFPTVPAVAGAAAAPPVGRLAPSPTGALHLGNARSFLLAWLSVRSRGGRLVLRMEDLDHPKVKPGAAAQALDDLHWLGLDWDEGPDRGGPSAPYVQTQRRDIYRDALHRLLGQGLVYPCTCSRADVEAAQSAPHAGEDGLAYPGTCRGRFPSWRAAVETLPQGRIPVWRFRSDRFGETAFDDLVCGPQRETVAETVGDFALARDPDGAGYMLAVAVDDAAMGVTEVLRGDDLLRATHRQLLVQRALGLPAPRYAHVPLVVAEDGRRLAKRHGDTRLAAIRDAGVPATRVCGILAWWCGWADFDAHVHPGELLRRFDLATLRREPAVLTDRVRDALGVRSGP